MLHNKTNRITLVLVYAFLEWVLIFLLLLNSLFSYLIIKFARYFGLKQPCLLCSRLDHILEPQNPNSSYRQLICEQHGVELSTSAYCYTHHKLVESDHMCDNCSFSHLHNHKHPSVVSVFRWLKEVGMVKSDGDRLVVENDDDDGINLRCSCCGVTVNRYIVSPAQIANRDELLYPSDCDDEDDQNGVDIQMGVDSDLINEDDNSDGFSFWLPKGGWSMVDDDQEEYGEVSKAQNSYVRERVLPHDAEFYIDLDDYQLVPVKMVSLEKESEDESRVDKADEKELNAENVSIHQTVANVGDKIKVGKLPTKHGQVMELKRELVIKMELEETMMKDKLSNKGDEKEIKIDVQLSVSDVQVPGETEAKNADFPASENDETEVEDTATKLGDELETMTVDANEGHEEEKRVVDDAELKDEDKQFQTSGDQAHDVLNTAFDDQVTEETANQVKFNIASSSEFYNQWKTENCEIVTLESSDSTGKDEMVEPSIQFKEEYPFTDVKKDAQFSVCDVQVPEETVVPNSDFPRSENDDTKVEDMALEQVDELGIMESDSTKVKQLLGKGHEEDKRVLDDAELMDINKKFRASGDQAHDVLITGLDDQVTEEIELNQVQTNIASSDLCSRENGEIDTLKSLELTDKSQMVEPSIPCKEECHFTNVITFEASTSSSTILLENGDCELKQTKESQEHNYVEVETILLFDSAVDKSIANELERIVEELKCDLKSEQNALRELYVELEEERNAAAVAANQTMLMISRLQEEKATIEMEALQYQRMMEEQSEYDQEALQLMNDILVKREKELEIFQKKISEYEERDKIRLRSRSCTEGNGDESDEESKCRCDQNGHQLDSFEEERLSILEQLKVLEEKLCSLSEEESIDQFEHFNGDSNGREKFEKGRMNGQKPKQLLPLFDAAEMESDDGLDSVLMIPKSSPRESETGSKRFEIEEEVDHMYDRLHALEADKEFIKHCIGSLRKGDRGLLLLQEILEHLRDLKSVELQSRNLYGSC